MDFLTATPNGWVPIGIVIAVGFVAATIDVWTFKVHNYLTAPLLVAGLLYHTLSSGVSGLAFSFIGAALGFTVLIVFYAMGGVGAGDVKLLAGIGAWLGPWTTINVTVIAGLATGLYALVLILFSGGYQNVKTNLSILAFRIQTMAIHFSQDERVETAVNRKDDRRRRLVPFAAMVALGIVGVVVKDHWGK